MASKEGKSDRGPVRNKKRRERVNSNPIMLLTKRLVVLIVSEVDGMKELWTRGRCSMMR